MHGSTTVGYIGVAPSAARTTAQTFPAASTIDGYPAFKNKGWRGIKVVLDITANANAGLTLTIKGYDKTSKKTWTLLAGSSEASTGTKVYTVYPGVTASANVAASDVLPESFQVTVAVGDAGSATYSIAAHLIP